MFVALNNETGERITSIAHEWRDKPEVLRDLAAVDRLACPECRQLVRFRQGEKRRPHFAHRHRADCPLEQQSAEVLEAKAQLYDWLCTKYPGKVELDLDQQIEGWKPFADLVVSSEGGKPFVYWVFDRQQLHRETFPYTLEHNGKLLHVIHTQATHQPWTVDPSLLQLTASQRDFTRFAPCDEPFRHCGHLCFLDTGKRELRIYRGLKCAHSPNIFSSEAVRTGPLSQALIIFTVLDMAAAAECARRAAGKPWWEDPWHNGALSPGKRAGSACCFSGASGRDRRACPCEPPTARTAKSTQATCGRAPCAPGVSRRCQRNKLSRWCIPNVPLMWNAIVLQRPA